MDAVDIKKVAYTVCKSLETTFHNEDLPYQMLQTLRIYPSETRIRISTSWSSPYSRAQSLRPIALNSKASLS